MMRWRAMRAAALAALSIVVGAAPAQAGLGPSYTYTIQLASINPGGSLFVGVNGTQLGAPATLKTTAGTAERWLFTATRGRGSGGASRYKIANRNSGKCLDLKGPSQERSTPVHQWNCGPPGYFSQAWIPFRHSDGTYQLESDFGGRAMCLDVTGFRDRPGTNLQIYDCSGGWNQRFRLTRVLPG